MKSIADATLKKVDTPSCIGSYEGPGHLVACFTQIQEVVGNDCANNDPNGTNSKWKQ